MLKVNEIFFSIQGESTYAGKPSVFVRLTGCNLRCTYCDTKYAYEEGTDFSIQEIVKQVEKYNCSLVEITGGEPLFQKETPELINELISSGFEVMLETSGSKDISNLNKKTKIILDVKTPSSGMDSKNLYSNFTNLKFSDEVKFVIGDENDFMFAKKIVEKYELDEKCEVLFSPVFGKIKPEKIVDLIMKNKLNVRFQLQMHKYIWEPDKRGV